MICNQHGCDLPAAFRFTWPGNDEAGICEEHAPKLRGVADAMGLGLQLIAIQVEVVSEVDVVSAVVLLKADVAKADVALSKVPKDRHSCGFAAGQEHYHGYRAGMRRALELLDPGAGST